MNKYTKNILNSVYKPLIEKYLLSRRTYKYEDIEVDIDPGVFHPGLFYSTKYLLEYLKTESIKGEKLLELGCGSGLISIYAARKGAKVFASDISEHAILCASKNSKKNKADIHIIKSDLFTDMSKTIFDYIIINPPFYPKDPKTGNDYAWYCGKDFNYFHCLFNSIGDFITECSKVIMVLSSECDIENISSLADKNNFELVQISKKYFLFETQFLYNLIFRK